ncbi:MLP-like protein 328 [Neltuma alba]|uniref:MLP-like protein 328 n=1 Tax=Neltuma alba TaxID=207710 RepID=UPI0010A31FF8|nr:MLP-like protein 328 [Prosopis alba]
MAQVCVLEATKQLRSPPEKIFNFLKSQNQKIPNATDKVHDVEVLNGDWVTPGSVKLWKFTLEGKEEVFKERVEVDEENKTLTYIALGGNVMELYKSYRLILKVEMNGTVKLRIEYEKTNGEVPPPHRYLQFSLNLLKEIEHKLV